MSNYSSGHEAERQVAQYLEKQGFKILELNWRTRWCEIDIIAEKDKIVHFVEVKLRKTLAQGSGLDYITPKKLKQMKFAAEFWLANNNFDGECVLSAAEIDDSLRINFLENIS